MSGNKTAMTEEQMDWVGCDDLDLMLEEQFDDQLHPAFDSVPDQKPRVERIFVEYMGPSTNSIYSGVHFSKRKKEADKGHRAVSLVKVPKFRKPVTLTFQPVLGKGARTRDCSNYSYTAKIIEDGLVQAGILQDDTPEYVQGFAIDAPVIDRSRASGMWVYIKEVQAA